MAFHKFKISQSFWKWACCDPEFIQTSTARAVTFPGFNWIWTQVHKMVYPALYPTILWTISLRSLWLLHKLATIHGWPRLKPPCWWTVHSLEASQETKALLLTHGVRPGFPHSCCIWHATGGEPVVMANKSEQQGVSVPELPYRNWMVFLLRIRLIYRKMYRKMFISQTSPGFILEAPNEVKSM